MQSRRLVVMLATSMAVACRPANEADTSIATALAYMDGPDSMATTVDYFFRPSDCGTGEAPFDTLWALARIRGARVRAVMLEPPLDTALASQFAARFSAQVPIVIDTDGAWMRRLRTSRLALPLFVIRERGRVTTIIHRATVTASGLALSATARDSNLLRHALEQRRVPHSTAREWRWRPMAGYLPQSQHTNRALIAAQLVTAGQGGLAVLDVGDDSVHVFGSDGGAKWAVSLSYHELRSPTDMRWKGAELFVVDAASGRVAFFSTGGTLSRVLVLGHPVRQLIAVSAGRFWGFDATDGAAFDYEFDATGAVVDSTPLPIEWSGLAPMLRESLVASVSSQPEVIVRVSRRQSAFYICNLAVRQCKMVRGVEPLAPPRMVEWRVSERVRVVRVDPAAPIAALALATDASHAYVLFEGKTASAGRTVDVYKLPTGRYVGTMQLPERALSLAHSDGRLIALTSARVGTPARIMTVPAVRMP